MAPRHTIVMVTSSYPRFAGDAVGTFMEPIARGVAARGHAVHLVAPWHPAIRRGAREDGITFHFFRYAPLAALNVFGYADAMRADVRLRPAAYLAAPLGVLAGWWMARRVAARVRATVLHGHWVVPSGAMAAGAAGGAAAVISLHGSDVYLAERQRASRVAARWTFRRADRVTACSADLRDRALALGAPADRIEVIPYGVDADRFRPDATRRQATRTALGLRSEDLLVFSAGRLVRKKGFEYLIDAVPRLASAWPTVRLAIAGSGDLEAELRSRAAGLGLAERVQLLGTVAQHELPAYYAAADAIAVPSVRDDEGNVDGLPNVVMEALASGTPLVTTAAGGIAAVALQDRTAIVVAERDAGALADGLSRLFGDRALAASLSSEARALVIAQHGWAAVAERLEAVYDLAVEHRRLP